MKQLHIMGVSDDLYLAWRKHAVSYKNYAEALANTSEIKKLMTTGTMIIGERARQKKKRGRPPESSKYIP